MHGLHVKLQLATLLLYSPSICALYQLQALRSLRNSSPADKQAQGPCDCAGFATALSASQLVLQHAPQDSTCCRQPSAISQASQSRPALLQSPNLSQQYIHCRPIHFWLRHWPGRSPVPRRQNGHGHLIHLHGLPYNQAAGRRSPSRPPSPPWPNSLPGRHARPA